MISEQILSALPAQSRDKLERLIEDKLVAHAAYLAASDRTVEAQTELAYYENMAAGQLSQGAGVEASYSPAAMVAAMKRDEQGKGEREKRIMAPVEAAKRRLQVAQDTRDRAVTKFNEFAFLDNVVSWLERTVRFGENFSATHLDIPKSRNVVADISNARDRVNQLSDEWIRTENVPLPPQELEARVFSEIDTIAERGAPSISIAYRSDEPLGLTKRISIDTRPGRDGATFIIGNAGAPLFVWLMQDELKKKVSALISGRDFQNALSDEDQENEFTRISSERLDLERHEEALVCLALAEGLPVIRRTDADPRAILGIHA